VPGSIPILPAGEHLPERHILGLKRREIQQRFDQIVAFSELERFLDTPVKRYSSGMYCRWVFP